MREKICILGLGYVGLPLAVEFGKKTDVVGFDINKKRVNELEKGLDSTLETSTFEIEQAINLSFTTSIKDISDCNIYIVTVPTPIDENKKPNLKPLKRCSETVAKVLNTQSINSNIFDALHIISISALA